MSSTSTVQARIWPGSTTLLARRLPCQRPSARPPLAVTSFGGAPCEAARTPLASPAGFLLPLLGHVDQHLLAALVGLAGAHVRAVGAHLPGAVCGHELGVDHLAQLLAEARVLDRRHHLDPALEVALHAVGGAD